MPWAHSSPRNLLNRIIQVNRLQFGVELNRTSPLFLERIAARFLDTAKGCLQGETGGYLVDFHDARLNSFGIKHRLFEIARDDGGGQADIESVGDCQGFVEILDSHHGYDGAKDFFAGDTHDGSDIGEYRWLNEKPVRHFGCIEAFAAA